ncbi:glutamate/tyrosine decarboxylase-like PLP-dependent enzyme [Natronospira proteinivora]|uniref:Glutamate/tyrosine decarboxylase-like PLP-dependent enzyme n=1 Tax=Natronospira proteinivora TaxID=1807133 RepID=A0ABT1G8C7_9GAMM|nr:pyridoxal-dependent decarboxylase [Natronospira proteinivora]MCP1727302.1 glutamate/tyrosine decarboxylase-like PLP-dependent enzyme [Natronospira proteinivora]
MSQDQIPEVDALFSPFFLGAYGENDELFEKLILEFFRDHVYWRRNLHPQDTPPIPIRALHSEGYLEFVDRMKTELHRLTADLKNSAPFFNPRYIGHMASDLLLPGLIAHLVTTLYNPNNVTEEAAPVTVRLELAAGRQLADMMGFNTDPAQRPCAWGHLTSGGTVANYEGLWNLRSAKYYPLAARTVMAELGLDPAAIIRKPLSLEDPDPWPWFNLDVDTVVRLQKAVAEALQGLPKQTRQRVTRKLESARVEHLGQADFHAAHPDLKPPVVLVPLTAHYSWKKAMKMMGFGSAQLISVPVTDHMRLDPKALEAELARLAEEGRPVLAVVGILGSTEYGTIDPIDDIVAIRQRLRRKAPALDFGIHVDAAWGGYMAALFREPGGGLRRREDVARGFKYFPSLEVHQAFAAIRHADTVTVDPHKLGYLPFGVGAFIARNREITTLLGEDAAYVFDEAGEGADTDTLLRNLGRYILEGSKPGSMAAATYVTHRVFPLDYKRFGKLTEVTVHSTEYLYDRLQETAERLASKVRLVVPFEPDTNLICIALNPEGNHSAPALNRFGKRIYEQLRVVPDQPPQMREFFGSRTNVFHDSLSPEARQVLTEKLGLDPDSFQSEGDGENSSNFIFLLRHTLMNPWLFSASEGLNYLDRYCRHLEALVLKELEAL